MEHKKYIIHYRYNWNPNVIHRDYFTTWQSDVEYAWRMSPANIPHTKIVKIEEEGSMKK